jgi:DNA repair protein RecO (recombination protein O)
MTLYEYQGRWSVKEAVTERQFHAVRSDLEKLSLASFFAEVTEALAEEGQPEPGLLSLILNCLHGLDKLDLPLRQVKTAFEWRSMALAGYAPMVDACAVCGKIDPADPRVHLREGLLHCASCRDGVGDGVSMPLTPGALAALRHIVKGDPKRLFSFRLDDTSLKQLADASEAYLMTQLERGFHTLDFYKSLTWET